MPYPKVGGFEIFKLSEVWRNTSTLKDSSSDGFEVSQLYEVGICHQQPVGNHWGIRSTMITMKGEYIYINNMYIIDIIYM